RGTADGRDHAPLPVERGGRFSVIELKPVALEVDGAADEVDRRPVPVHDPAGEAVDLRVLVDGGNEISQPGGCEPHVVVDEGDPLLTSGVDRPVVPLGEAV